MSAENVVVIDFETSGMSPDYGDRAIEIGAVRLVDGKIADEFQSLMNPGFRVNSFIQDFTGIDNGMLEKAPGCSEVMREFHEFLGDSHLIAHNSSFDKRFLDSEFSLINKQYSGEFACSMLLARRIYQDAPNHKLASLVDYRDIQYSGVFHRALDDAQMTAKLWLAMLEDIGEWHQCWDLPFSWVKKLSKTPKKNVPKLLQEYRNRMAS